MVRMQVQFTEEQAQRLRQIARSRGVSIALVVREAVDAVLGGRTQQRDAWERTLAVLGRFKGPGGSAGDEHDEWFAEAVEARLRR